MGRRKSKITALPCGLGGLGLPPCKQICGRPGCQGSVSSPTMSHVAAERWAKREGREDQPDQPEPRRADGGVMAQSEGTLWIQGGGGRRGGRKPGQHVSEPTTTPAQSKGFHLFKCIDPLLVSKILMSFT